MGVSTEWSEAASLTLSYEDWTDAYGTESDGPALVLSLDDAIVIEGSQAELLALADRIKETVLDGYCTSCSRSRQHFIDTGNYLPEDECEEQGVLERVRAEPTRKAQP